MLIYLKDIKGLTDNAERIIIYEDNSLTPIIIKDENKDFYFTLFSDCLITGFLADHGNLIICVKEEQI